MKTMSNSEVYFLSRVFIIPPYFWTLKTMRSCEGCPHLQRKDFDGLPFWRCNRPKAESNGQRGRPNVQGKSAIEWLKEYLQDGPKPAGNINATRPEGILGDAITAGHKPSTVRRAAKILGVLKEKVDGRWLWSLPEKEGGGES